MLLLGANGQVGFELQRSLAPLGNVIATTRSGRLPGGAACVRIDLADAGAVDALLREIEPDAVVNAAAYTAVDRAEDEADAAFALNAALPGQLAAWCATRDALLLHYSTDYVFDGSATRPYREDDATAPLGVYGRSKLAGEDAIRDAGALHLIFRTAWVYAARGQNFLRTMLRLGAEREVLRVVADQRGAPTPARWIASASALALARCRSEAAPDSPDDAPIAARAWDEALTGTFNLVADGESHWSDFAETIFADALAAGLLERAPRVEPIGTLDYPTRAARPAYSRLDGAKLRDTFGLRLPDWREGVRQVVGELAPA
nr:dTDP-4-dehydrorhamnose reductase [Chiayiivirga flava]